MSAQRSFPLLACVAGNGGVCSLGGSPRTGVPSAGHRQGKDRKGRTKVNPRKLRYPELRKMEAAPEKRTRRWEAAVVVEVSMSATRAPRSRSIGGTRHRSHLTSAEHGNPVKVRWTRPTAGRPTVREADIRGGNRTAKKRMAVHRKVAGKRRRMTVPLQPRSASYNWPHTTPSAWARKGADVSRVAL